LPLDLGPVLQKVAVVSMDLLHSNMETVRISEMLAIQLTMTQYHHSEAGVASQEHCYISLGFRLLL